MGAGREAAVGVAEHVAERCAGILGGKVRSVVLYGSLATADFIPGTSDVDLLVVVDGPLSAAETQALEQVVRTADLGTASGVDVHVVTSAVALDPAASPALELHLGRYGRSTVVEVARKVAEAQDLLPELSLARATARRLLGAEPRDVLGAVPTERVRQRGRYWLTVWQDRTDDDQSAALMVLTACRIWHFAVEGTHCSKVEAAQWALGRNRALPVVAQALRRHTVDPDAPVDEECIGQLLAAVLREVDAASRPG